jgi:hypothetical protein
VAHAYRDFARAHRGGYGYIQRAPAPDETDLAAAAGEVLSVLGDVLDGYGITGADAVDAIRLLRSTLHGFVTLEISGGFALPQSVDASFDRLVDATHRALVGWGSPVGEPDTGADPSA